MLLDLTVPELPLTVDRAKLHRISSEIWHSMDGLEMHQSLCDVAIALIRRGQGQQLTGVRIAFDVQKEFGLH